MFGGLGIRRPARSLYNVCTPAAREASRPSMNQTISSKMGCGFMVRRLPLRVARAVQSQTARHRCEGGHGRCGPCLTMTES